MTREDDDNDNNDDDDNNNNNNNESQSPVEGAVFIWEVPGLYLGTRHHIQKEVCRASRKGNLRAFPR